MSRPVADAAAGRVVEKNLEPKYFRNPNRRNFENRVHKKYFRFRFNFFRNKYSKVLTITNNISNCFKSKFEIFATQTTGRVGASSVAPKSMFESNLGYLMVLKY